MNSAYKMDCSVQPFTIMLEVRPGGENASNAAAVPFQDLSLQDQNGQRSKFRAPARKRQAHRLSVANRFSTANLSRQPPGRCARDTPRSASARCGVSLRGDKAAPEIQIGRDEICFGSPKYTPRVVGVFDLFSASGRHRTAVTESTEAGLPRSISTIVIC
jgi:hypothetical protein